MFLASFNSLILASPHMSGMGVLVGLFFLFFMILMPILIYHIFRLAHQTLEAPTPAIISIILLYILLIWVLFAYFSLIILFIAILITLLLVLSWSYSTRKYKLPTSESKMLEEYEEHSVTREDKEEEGIPDSRS